MCVACVCFGTCAAWCAFLTCCCPPTGCPFMPFVTSSCLPRLAEFPAAQLTAPVLPVLPLADTITAVGITLSGDTVPSGNSITIRTPQAGAPTLASALPSSPDTAVVRINPPGNSQAASQYTVSICLKSAPTNCIRKNSQYIQITVPGLTPGASYIVTATGRVNNKPVPSSNSLPLVMPARGAPVLLTAGASSARTGAATAAAPNGVTFSQVRPVWENAAWAEVPLGVHATACACSCMRVCGSPVPCCMVSHAAHAGSHTAVHLHRQAPGRRHRRHFQGVQPTRRRVRWAQARHTVSKREGCCITRASTVEHSRRRRRHCCRCCHRRRCL